MSQFNKYDLVVFIGRFQPFHNGHHQAIVTAYQNSNNVLVILGSCNLPRTMKNPFSAAERREMINGAEKDIIVKYSYDVGSNEAWIQQIQSIVEETAKGLCLTKDAKIAIVGHIKDESSEYLTWFPQWDFIDNNFYKMLPIDATKIRELWFEGQLHYAKSVLHHSVYDFLKEFSKDPLYKEDWENLKGEYEFIKEYKKKWAAAPYAPTFVTTDAVVHCGGHVLMVKRGGYPGKGQWALPGGFLNQKETLVAGMLRELQEETKIKVPPAVLDSSIKTMQIFDKPDRSLRGRTITHAFLIELNETKLPKVKAADDAAECKWFTLTEIHKMSNMIFEDHYAIITSLLGVAPQVA